MTPNNSTSTVYSSIVAGSLPVDKSDSISAVNYALLELLGTDGVHVIISYDADNGVAHYIGVPTNKLAAASDFRFPLSCALPGHPEFKGDGCYLQEGAPISAVVEVRNGRIQYICNETHLVDAYVSDCQLPVHKIDDMSSSSWAFHSHRSEILKFSGRVSKWVIVTGFVVFIAMIGLQVSLTILSSVNTSKLKSIDIQYAQEQEEHRYQELLSIADATSQLSLSLYRIQYISSSVIKAGGWINQYNIKGGTEDFEVIMPEWVSRDYLEPYGTNFRTTLTADGVRLLSKNNLVFKP